MKFKQKYFSIIPALILYLALSNSSCSEDNPVVPPPSDKEQFVKLSTLTVTCTEAFIKVSVNDTLLPLNITLSRDDSPVFSFNLTKNDTTIIDTNLSPGGSYNYNAAAVINGEEWTGDKLQVQTLATTSHNFAWQTWTFGEYSSSVFYDVAIIDENNIWAVGEIYMNDSLGNPDPNAYNAAHWNGNEWQLKRIYFPTVCGSTNLSSYPAKAIFVFDDSKIWISSSGDKIAILENGIQIDKFCLPSNVSMSINKIWGNSSNDIYVVGNAGNIAHYKNGSWSKIESGTSLNINDIFGIYNERTNEWEILAVGGNILEGTERIILKITGENQAEIISPQGTISYPLSSIWFSGGFKYYVGGAGIYTKYYNENTWEEIPLPEYFTYSIRGNVLNDIVVCGGLGYVAHFNGISWMNYLGNGLDLIAGNYYSVSMKGDIICAVGIADGKAVVIIGTR